MAGATTARGIELHWLPLGAGGHFVRLNGRAYEALAAWRERRRRRPLFHSALEARAPGGVFTIEMAPAWSRDDPRRGVVAEGSVGLPGAGRLRLFRYEVRRWRDGVIPDLAEAVGGPRHLTGDADQVQRLLDLVPLVPTPVWGRDELDAGEMWNSNSVIAWLIARIGIDAAAIAPPGDGRAPGWRAGVVVAARSRNRREPAR